MIGNPVLLETERDLDECLAFVRVGRHEQGLLRGIQAPLSGVGLLGVGANGAGIRFKARCDRGTVALGTACETSCVAGFLRR